MSFPLFFVGFLEKWTKREKYGQLRGSFAAAKRPLATVKDSHATARPRGKVGPASGSPQRSHYSMHGNVMFLFRFVFSLFQRLVHWTNEDLKCMKGFIHVCKVK